MERGRDEERSVLVFVGVGDSWVCSAECGGGVTGVPTEGDAVVEDLGAPPKADMKERTMQGVNQAR